MPPFHRATPAPRRPSRSSSIRSSSPRAWRVRRRLQTRRPTPRRCAARRGGGTSDQRESVRTGPDGEVAGCDRRVGVDVLDEHSDRLDMLVVDEVAERLDRHARNARLAQPSHRVRHREPGERCGAVGVEPREVSSRGERHTSSLARRGSSVPATPARTAHVARGIRRVAITLMTHPS